VRGVAPAPAHKPSPSGGSSAAFNGGSERDRQEKATAPRVVHNRKVLADELRPIPIRYRRTVPGGPNRRLYHNHDYWAPQRWSRSRHLPGTAVPGQVPPASVQLPLLEQSRGLPKPHAAYRSRQVSLVCACRTVSYFEQETDGTFRRFRRRPFRST